MVKQYVYRVAYSGNTEILLYEGGKEVRRLIVSDYALPAALSEIENEGFTAAYDLREYRQAVKDAFSVYMEAIENLSMAEKNPLLLTT